MKSDGAGSTIAFRDGKAQTVSFLINLYVDGIMVSVKRKIVRNTAANTFMKLWRYAVNFFLLPFIILHVGVEDYGLYLLVGAFVGYFGLLDLGVGASLVKYVAEYNAKGDKEMINKMVNSTFVFYLGVGIAVCLGVMAIGYFFVDFFRIEEGSVELARAIALMVAIGALTSWPIRSFTFSLQGLQRYDMNVLVDFITVTITAAVTVTILLAGYGIIELIFTGIVVGAVGQIAKVILVQRMMPFLDLRKRYMGMKTMKMIFTFSSVVFATEIIWMLMMGLDRLVIGLFVGVAAVTFYYICRALYDIVNTVAMLPISATLPAASELVAQKDEKKLRSLVYRVGKYRAAAVLPISISIIIFAKDILRLWMGVDYIWLAPYVQLFVSYWFLGAAWGVLSNILLAREKLRMMLNIYVVNAIINVFFSVTLTYLYGWVGVILGTLLGWATIAPWAMKTFLRGSKIPAREYFRNSLWPAYAPAGAMALLLLGLRHFIVSEHILVVGTLGMLGLAVYFGLFYWKGLNGAERAEIKTVFSKLIGKKNSA